MIQARHFPLENLYGLVACGGNSSRMGTDKSMLVYHDEPQCFHVYEMIENLCEKVFISCNSLQAANIPTGYSILRDNENYKNCGPMTGLLSAFCKYPDKDFLLVGCDYPFLTGTDIRIFLESQMETRSAAAFYNETHGMYEPILALYGSGSGKELLEMFYNGQNSLQDFLKIIKAKKFLPANPLTIQSIDTKDGFLKAKDLLARMANVL